MQRYEKKKLPHAARNIANTKHSNGKSYGTEPFIKQTLLWQVGNMENIG